MNKSTTPQLKQVQRERRRVDTEPEPLDDTPLTPEEARRQLGWDLVKPYNGSDE